MSAQSEVESTGWSEKKLQAMSAAIKDIVQLTQQGLEIDRTGLTESQCSLLDLGLLLADRVAKRKSESQAQEDSWQGTNIVNARARFKARR